MLKYIQEVMQTLLKESSKSKLRVKKSKGNRFDITRGKTSINPEILAPNVVNEKLDIENTKDIVNLKNTYEMLMKKFVNPRLDLMVTGMRSLEQLKLFHLKRKGDMVSSYTASTDLQQMPTLPCNKSKKSHSKDAVTKVGWSGQPTDKHALAPKVETSLYPGDIHSAFFVFPEIEELSSPKKSQEESKRHKKLCKIIDNKLTPLRIKNKPVQLVKQIPKSHISKFYDFNQHKNENESKEQNDFLKHTSPLSPENIAGKDNFNNSLKNSEKTQNYNIEKMEITDKANLAQTNNFIKNAGPHQLSKEGTTCGILSANEEVKTSCQNILNSADFVECINTTALTSDNGVSEQTAINNMLLDKSLEQDNSNITGQRLNVSPSNLISPEKTSSIETSIPQCKKIEKPNSHKNANKYNVDSEIHVEQSNRICNNNSVGKDTIEKQNDNASNKKIEETSKMPVVNYYNNGYKFYKSFNKKVFRDKYLQMPVTPKPKEIMQKKGGIIKALTQNVKDAKISKSSVKIDHTIVNNQYEYLKLVKNKKQSFENQSKGKGFFSDLTSHEENKRARLNTINKNVSEQHKRKPKINKNVYTTKGFEQRNNKRSSSHLLSKHKSHTFNFKNNKKERVSKTKFGSKSSLITALPKNNFNQHPETIKTEIVSERKAMNPNHYVQPPDAIKKKVINKVKTERDANKLHRSHSYIGISKKSVSKKLLFYKPKVICKHGQKELALKKPIVNKLCSKIETHNTKKLKSNGLKNRSDNIINKTILLSKENAKFCKENQLSVKSISHEKFFDSKKDKLYKNISLPDLTEISSAKDRKLHSKKLNLKPMSLKMYGKDQIHDKDSYTSDVRSLKSIPIVRKVKKSTQQSKPLGNLKRSSVENLNNVQKNSNALIMSTKIHSRNLFTAEYKANMMVNYLYRRFASTTVEKSNTSNRLMVKNATKNVLRVTSVPNILDQSKNKPQATQTTTCSDQIKPLRTVLKYKHNKSKYILPTSLMNGNNNSASAAMVINKKLHHQQNCLHRKVDSEIHLKKPFMEHTPDKLQNNDYKVEVLYSRQDNKNKTFPILQRENQINLVTAETHDGFNTNSDNINCKLITINKPPQKRTMHKDSGNPITILKQSNYCSDSFSKSGPGSEKSNELSINNLNSTSLKITNQEQKYVPLKVEKEQTEKKISQNGIKGNINTNVEQSQQTYEVMVDKCHKSVKESKLRDPTKTLNSVNKVVKAIITPIKVKSSQLDMQHKKKIDNFIKCPRKWKSKVERLQQNKVILENSPKNHATGNKRKITVIKCHSICKNMNLTNSASSEIKTHSPHIGLLEVSSNDVLPNMSYETQTGFMKGKQSDKHLTVSSKQTSISKYRPKNSNLNLEGEKQAKITEIKLQEKHHKQQNLTKINIKSNYIRKHNENGRNTTLQPPVDITKKTNEKSICKFTNSSKISNNMISKTTNKPNEQNISRDTDNKVTIPHSTNTTLPEEKPLTKMENISRNNNKVIISHSTNTALPEVKPLTKIENISQNSDNKVTISHSATTTHPEIKPSTKMVPLDITGVDHSINKTLINSSYKLNKINKTIKECNRSIQKIGTVNHTNNVSSLNIENETSTAEKANNGILKSNLNILPKCQNTCKGTVADHNTSNTKIVADNNVKTSKDHIKKDDNKLSGKTNKLNMSSQLQNAIELDRNKPKIYELSTMSKKTTDKTKPSGVMDVINKKGLSTKLTDLGKKTTESSKSPGSNEGVDKKWFNSKLTDIPTSHARVNKKCVSSKLTDINDNSIDTSKLSDGITLHIQNQNQDISSKMKPIERDIDFNSKRNTLHEGLLRSLKLTVHPVQNITNLNYSRKPQINSLEENLTVNKGKEKLSKNLKTNKDNKHSESPKNIKVHQLAIAELRKFEKKTKEGVKTIVNHVLNTGSKIGQIYRSPPQTPLLENSTKLDKKIHPIEKEKYDLVFLASSEDLLSDSPTDKSDIKLNMTTQNSLEHVKQNNTEETHENTTIQSLKPTGTQLKSRGPKKRVTFIKESRTNENHKDILLL